MNLWDSLRRSAFISASVALAGFAGVVLLDEMRSPSWVVSFTFAATCIAAILIGLLCDVVLSARKHISQELRESTFEWVHLPLKAGLFLLPTQHQARYLEEFRSEILEQPNLSTRDNLKYSIRAAASLVALLSVLAKEGESELALAERYHLGDIEELSVPDKSEFQETNLRADKAAILAISDAPRIDPTWRPARLGRTSRFLVWMGGASSGDLGDPYEVTQYKMSGILGFLTATIAFEVTAIAAASVLSVSIWTTLPFAATWAVMISALDRSIATRVEFADRSSFSKALNYSARIVSSIIIGILIAETASLALLKTSVEARLSQDIAENARSLQFAVLNNDPYIRNETSRIDRVYQEASDDSVKAEAEVALAELKLTCEAAGGRQAGCETVTSTGVPGVGQLTRLLESDLASAQKSAELAQVRLDQIRQQTDSDRMRLADYTNVTLNQARNTAEADTGIGARWRAMNELTFQDNASFYVRGVIAVLFILLGLLPLFSKMWRGTTIHDKRITARRIQENLQLNYQVQAERIRINMMLRREYDRQDRENVKFDNPPDP